MQPSNDEHSLIRAKIIDLNTSARLPSFDHILKDGAENSSRKRVRFDAYHNEPERMKVRVVETLRPSSAMTKEEKDAAWYQKQHFHENIRSSRLYATTLASRCNIDCDIKDYANALVSTYASCTVEDWQDSRSNEHCAQHLALLTTVQCTSMEGESTRGLEKVAVPFVGREAVRRRNDAISSVLLAQSVIGNKFAPHERQELIRIISEEQSKCARKFAKAMGIVDAMSALMEYDWSSREIPQIPSKKELASDVKASSDASVSLLSIPFSQDSMVVHF